jgi:hypothetical protein
VRRGRAVAPLVLGARVPGAVVVVMAEMPGLAGHYQPVAPGANDDAARHVTRPPAPQPLMRRPVASRCRQARHRLGGKLLGERKKLTARVIDHHPGVGPTPRV